MRHVIFLALIAAIGFAGTATVPELLGGGIQPAAGTGTRAAANIGDATFGLRALAIGLLVGIAAAWYVFFDWAGFRERALTWLAELRRRLMWLLAGSLCVGILLFF